MALSDLLDLADLVDLVRSWRFFIPTIVGVGAAILLSTSFSESTLVTAAAIILGLAGVLIGLVWQIQHERVS